MAAGDCHCHDRKSVMTVPADPLTRAPCIGRARPRRRLPHVLATGATWPARDARALSLEVPGSRRRSHRGWCSRSPCCRAPLQPPSPSDGCSAATASPSGCHSSPRCGYPPGPPPKSRRGSPGQWNSDPGRGHRSICSTCWCTCWSTAAPLKAERERLWRGRRWRSPPLMGCVTEKRCRWTTFSSS
jgi:hypothetical protein